MVLDRYNKAHVANDEHEAERMMSWFHRLAAEESSILEKTNVEGERGIIVLYMKELDEGGFGIQVKYPKRFCLKDNTINAESVLLDIMKDVYKVNDNHEGPHRYEVLYEAEANLCLCHKYLSQWNYSVNMTQRDFRQKFEYNSEKVTQEYEVATTEVSPPETDFNEYMDSIIKALNSGTASEKVKFLNDGKIRSMSEAKPQYLPEELEAMFRKEKQEALESTNKYTHWEEYHTSNDHNIQFVAHYKHTDYYYIKNAEGEHCVGVIRGLFQGSAKSIIRKLLTFKELKDWMDTNNEDHEDVPGWLFLEVMKVVVDDKPRHTPSFQTMRLCEFIQFYEGFDYYVYMNRTQGPQIIVQSELRYKFYTLSWLTEQFKISPDETEEKVPFGIFEEALQIAKLLAQKER